MSIENPINRCADAVSIINGYLLANQKSNSYNRWLERYSKHPSEHDDDFLFGKLAQAIFSGGLNGEVIDNWMPRMEEVFHGWNVEWISKLSAKDIELIAKSGQVLANRPKLKAVVSNARIVIGLKSKYGSFGQYLASFKSPVLRSTELANRFVYLGEVTTEDFLRNIGFDTAKPDRHLTRWLERMQTIDSATPGKVLEVIYLIAEAAKLSHAKYDTIIYLFCADRHDVLENGGVCGNIPNCGLCPISRLCPRNIVSSATPQSRPKASRPILKKPKTKNTSLSKSDVNTVWNTKYPGMSLEEVKQVNPDAESWWLNEPLRVDITPLRRSDMEKLFDGKTMIDRARINVFNDNKGKYVAFRAVTHGYAVWEDGVLRLTKKGVTLIGEPGYPSFATRGKLF